MKEYCTRINIDAPVDKVWEILMDTKKYPEWDPYAEKIEGDIRLGSRIKAFSKINPGRAFPVRVTKLEKNRRMVWQGGMPFGLFKGVRTFCLESLESGTTEFSMKEVFSGPMFALIGKSIPDMTDPFEKFAQGLKARAEN